ncbi:MAG: hypothetical protein A2270_11405 [Elusimicrobia bacterium RIFOXYA12_FULL_51_18]|nr:MAG: hypothetical protein A2270_11405 [Elusimicrobia bacterium RIFOXYA12_FULL_51_18]OGS30241.1 MAG: hypothetical protein A2218_12165 [Elusimicrobia bacterium RIFOXYA2_FULL_53_38]
MDDIRKMIHWLGHASFRLELPSGIMVYLDPYLLTAESKKADVILITHGHFDHFSLADIAKIIKKETMVFGPESLSGKILGGFTGLKPGDKAEFRGIVINAVPAYNIGKPFHPRASGNLGYVVDTGDLRVYHAGDTDFIPEMEDIKADVALFPIGGTYTMDAVDACRAALALKPRAAVPMHYGSVVGSKDEAVRFKNLCNVCEMLILPQEE